MVTWSLGVCVIGGGPTLGGRGRGGCRSGLP
jgi:hypothetical protein